MTLPLKIFVGVPCVACELNRDGVRTMLNAALSGEIYGIAMCQPCYDKLRAATPLAKVQP